jgi:cobalamin-dependent methionine synthase I
VEAPKTQVVKPTSTAHSAIDAQNTALQAVKSVPTMPVPKRPAGVIDPKAARMAAAAQSDPVTITPGEPKKDEKPQAQSASKAETAKAENVKIPSAVVTKDLQQLHNDNPVMPVPEASAKEPWNVKPYEGAVHSSFVGVTPPLSVSIDALVPLIKRISLFENRWGYRQGTPEWENREKELAERIEAIKKDAKIDPQIIFGYYPVRVEGNKIWVNAGDGFRLFAAFPENERGECFAELFKTTTDRGVIPMQVVTLGANAQEYVEEFFVSGKYGDYYSTHGLFSELTEALSLYTSRILAKGLTFMGKDPKFLRFSFGYPRLPDLAGNRQLLALLMSEQIGVNAGDSEQMFPLYTTSALVSWHPEGKY